MSNSINEKNVVTNLILQQH